MKRLGILLLSGLAVAGLITVYFFWLNPTGRSSRTRNLMLFLRNPQSYQDWMTEAQQRCGDAPFLMPTSGYIGYLWDDSFRVGHHHQGIDVFGGGEPGDTPVYAVFDGYLTREQDWKSSVIMRVPSDPLNPDRQIWLYYTHMAYESGESLIASDFPAGSREVLVKAGTLLGYQGNYSGNPGNPTGVHLHFSIVQDDGAGKYRNELDIVNTLDPGPYLGMPLNNNENGVTPVHCFP